MGLGGRGGWRESKKCALDCATKVVARLDKLVDEEARELMHELLCAFIAWLRWFWSFTFSTSHPEQTYPCSIAVRVPFHTAFP